VAGVTVEDWRGMRDHNRRSLLSALRGGYDHLEAAEVTVALGSMGPSEVVGTRVPAPETGTASTDQQAVRTVRRWYRRVRWAGVEVETGYVVETSTVFRPAPHAALQPQPQPRCRCRGLAEICPGEGLTAPTTRYLPLPGIRGRTGNIGSVYGGPVPSVAWRSTTQARRLLWSPV